MQPKDSHNNRPGRSFDRKSEEKIYGKNACLAVFLERPGDIIRIYAENSRKGIFGELLSWAAKEKKAYHLVESEELSKVSESTHHEGICILVKRKAPLKLEQLLPTLKKEPRSALLYLDGVSNPHNFGAIIRSAAHFGVTAILTNQSSGVSLSSAAQRVAEGGAESVEFVRVEDPRDGMELLKQAGFKVIASAPKASQSLFTLDQLSKVVFIVGSEAKGASSEILALADLTVKIPGTGAIESLNVATASALLLAEWYRNNS